MISGFTGIQLDAISFSASTTTNVLMAGNMIINLFLSASL